MIIASLTFVTGNFEKNSNIFNSLYTNEISITLVIYLSFKSWLTVPEYSNKFILESLRLKILSKKSIYLSAAKTAVHNFPKYSIISFTLFLKGLNEKITRKGSKHTKKTVFFKKKVL